MSDATSVVWLRRDLRLDDNPALHAARDRKQPVIPVFIDESEAAGEWALGGASRLWLHHSIKSFKSELKELGSKLILRKGKASEVLKKLVKEVNADRVYFNRRMEGWGIEEDSRVEKALSDIECEVEVKAANLLYQPGEVCTKEGKVYLVFSPFWRAAEKTAPAKPVAKVTKIDKPKSWPKSDKLESWNLLPKIDWNESIEAEWQPGIEGARQKFKSFFKDKMKDYKKARDFPAMRGTSQISPHLHFGEVSPRTLYWYIKEKSKGRNEGRDWFIRELGWREFGHHLLYHLPHLPNHPLRDEFKDFPWKKNKSYLKAWQKGQTGYPIVDAGMRELWATGYMHNRVRMIVASFLVKHLLQHWLEGARWFWDCLVDADLANNTLGWQWAAGCGPDAAPYFRIFNPTLQSQKFDQDGEYIKKWVPELEGVDKKYLHEPWEAPSKIKDYPDPIVEHKDARKKALEAFEKIKKK